MRLLFVIPARGGSKGLPGKNIKPLNKKPLIIHSLHYARLFSDDSNICISTDDSNIASVVREEGYKTLFLRPAALAGDESGMWEVILHALDFYEKKSGPYDAVVLLQPTSPFRLKRFMEEALAIFTGDQDMLVGVNESKANPYFNLFEENAEGFLELSKKKGKIVRRQDAPPVYQYNGSLYIINAKSLRLYGSLSEFPRIVKYVMPEEYGTDIDNAADWAKAEYLINNHLVNIDGKLQNHSKA